MRVGEVDRKVSPSTTIAADGMTAAAVKVKGIVEVEGVVTEAEAVEASAEVVAAVAGVEAEGVVTSPHIGVWMIWVEVATKAVGEVGLEVTALTTTDLVYHLRRFKLTVSCPFRSYNCHVLAYK